MFLLWCLLQLSSLTVLSLPVKKPFVSRYEWTIDCFLQVTGHWHQVWITPRGTSITFCFKKMCDRGCFSQMGDVLFASLRVSKLQKLEKGSILRVHNGVHLMMEVAPPPSIKAWPLCSSQWLKGHKVWLKPKALWAYKHARWKPCCCGIFCSRFHPILSPLKIILEMVFWTNLMLDLICTCLEKTRKFCRQVNKNISSCFWTASTCVKRSS